MVGGWAEEEGGSDLDTNVIQGRKHEHESFIVGCGKNVYPKNLCGHRADSGPIKNGFATMESL